MSATITNPILPGFNPDPSICRVGDDYYIATSTFEWYPGVQIHHSTDLVNWRLVSRPLNRPDLLDMRGNPDSCGVWAPCLTHSEGVFYLVYTDVKRHSGDAKDAHNYITRCATIDGDWQAPVYINSSGFDPSLFHDDDGRRWFLNMLWDYRPDKPSFGGIVLQELDRDQLTPIGPVHNVFAGSDLGMVEGPHLYKRNGYYYLLTAEGGTEYDHACTLARSRELTGPYELHPKQHLITARFDPQCPLQRAGHGDLVETPEGETYLVHLCSRPLANRGRSPLGRETAIQKLTWGDDDWLWPDADCLSPQIQVPGPETRNHTSTPARETDIDYRFTARQLPVDFQWLRTPFPETLFSLSERPGYLRLYGRESLGSLFNSSLVARRQQSQRFTASTTLDFQPRHFQQMAGLVCYYNSRKYHYVFISHDESLGRCLDVMSCLADANGHGHYPLNGHRIPLPAQGPVRLRAEVDFEHLYFSWASQGENWQRLPLKLDYSVLSDEAGTGAGNNFTGAFVGMAAQDLSGTGTPADFSGFEYREGAGLGGFP